MSGSDSPPTRGIEPPTAGSGPPPAPDFGVAAPPAVVEPAAVYPDIPSQPASRPGALIAIIVAIVAVLVVVLALVVVGIGNIVTLAGTAGGAAPSSETDNSGQSQPNPDPFAPAPDSGAVETALQAKIDEYKSARDNGALWNRIPDSSYNRTAVSAFLYFLIDMKLAASFGGTGNYLEQADELERKLLNQEPLGSDISIKLSDRTFTYDGDTGEGGYTAN